MNLLKYELGKRRERHHGPCGIASSRERLEFRSTEASIIEVSMNVRARDAKRTLNSINTGWALRRSYLRSIATWACH